MAKTWLAFEHFQRECDALFDDLLIKRWREALPIFSAEQTFVIDHGDRYEVRIWTSDADPNALEVEVAEHQLTVRAPGRGGAVTRRSFTLSDAVDRDAVSAKWSERRLIIVLPKRSKSDE